MISYVFKTRIHHSHTVPSSALRNTSSSVCKWADFGSNTTHATTYHQRLFSVTLIPNLSLPERRSYIHRTKSHIALDSWWITVFIWYLFDQIDFELAAFGLRDLIYLLFVGQIVVPSLLVECQYISSKSFAVPLAREKPKNNACCKLHFSVTHRMDGVGLPMRLFRAIP